MTIKRDAKGRFVSTKPKETVAIKRAKASKPKTKPKTKKSTVKPKAPSKTVKTTKKKTASKTSKVAPKTKAKPKTTKTVNKKAVKEVVKKPKNCGGLMSCESWVESKTPIKKKTSVKKSTKVKTPKSADKSLSKPKQPIKEQVVEAVMSEPLFLAPLMGGVAVARVTKFAIDRHKMKKEKSKSRIGEEDSEFETPRKFRKKEKKEKIEKPRAERMSIKERYKSEKERRGKIAEGFYGSEVVYEESKPKRDKMIEQLHKRMEYEESEKQKAKEKKDNELNIVLDYNKLSEYRERAKQQKKASENLDKLEYLQLKEKPIVYSSPQPEKPKTDGPRVSRSVLAKVREKESN